MHHTTFAILAILSRGSTDGPTILRDWAATASPGRAPSLPTLYRHLREAVDRGWIAVAHTSERGGQGRPSQSYRLTAAGRKAARKEAEHLRHLSNTVLEPWAGR